MNKILSEIFETEKVIDQKGNIYPLKDYICPRDGEFLQRLIRDNGSVKTLEIGLAYGISTLYICEALLENGPDVKHIAIDCYQKEEYHNIGIENIKRAGYSHIFEFQKKRSELYLPSLLQKKRRIGRQFDFIFIDGDHAMDYCMVDFFYSDKIIRPGGIIVLDDFHFPSVKKVVDYINTKPEYKTLEILKYRDAPNSPGEKIIAFQRIL